MANTAICDLGGSQVIPKIATSPDGVTYVSWFSDDSGNHDVRLQRYDSFGNELWPQEGIVVSSHTSMSWLTDWDMIIDDDNSAILTFQDIRTGSNNVYAYRISPDGVFLWGDDGIPLSNNSDFEASPRVAVTAENNAVFAWIRATDPNGVVMMQKVSPAGAALWGDGIILRACVIKVGFSGARFPVVFQAIGNTYTS